MTFEEKIKQIDFQFSNQKASIKGPSEFKNIIQKFSFSLEEVSEHLIYPEQLPYGRKCVFRSDNFELIVMNWKPFQQSNIHDHGISFGCVYSVSGKANNLLFNAKLEQIESIPLINKNIAEVPCGIYHVIENNEPEYAVSLHFYAPPLKGMNVIDKNNKDKSFVSSNDSGAWNPEA